MSSLRKIYVDDKYKFTDGEIGKKLFIVIHVQQDFYLVLKTTSQSKRYSNVRQFCNPNKLVFYLPGHLKAGLDGDTYIQLHEIKKYTPQDLLQGNFNKTIREVSELKDDIFNGLINCLKKCKDDIEEDIYNLLFSSGK
ncbi:hypothetical protein [Leptospira adleri]|uniref:hypothetical protein n=1 Tax=Leptospira adleri TaxID=2023186 RepID=UPI00108264DC|nr:hypothetical protein [Leptospira adleri]TGM58675.1 hypothetical protein EHQ97_06180 [Leptospira adleri]